MKPERKKFIDLQIKNKEDNNKVFDTLQDNEERIYYSIYGHNKMPKSLYDLSQYNWADNKTLKRKIKND